MRPWAKGLLQASGKEEILQKDKPLKESYDRENNRLEEITRKKQEGRRERKPQMAMVLQLPSKVFYTPRNKAIVSSGNIYCRLGKFRSFNTVTETVSHF